MRLIKPSYEIIDIRPRGIAIPDDMEIGPRYIREEKVYTIYRQIEAAGRTCYKSEDKITETSAKEFVERMINSGHYAMLEFGTVYLKCPVTYYNVVFTEELQEDNPLRKYEEENHSRSCVCNEADSKDYCFVTTNYRVLIENNWLKDLQYICEPTEYHEKRICVKFTVDRGISHELVRHRVFSFAQESSRYCNYSKDKFGNELTYIIPSSFKDIKKATKEELSKVYGDKRVNAWYSPDNIQNDWIINLLDTEITYLAMIGQKIQPQIARSVLPTCVKTEINMCGFATDWQHVFDLRDDSHAHPDMQAIMKPLHEEFKKKFKIK